MLTRVLFCLTFLLLLVCSYGQTSSSPKYGIIATPICWKTGGVDSNLLRYTLVSPSSGQPKKLFYLNSLGTAINPLGGVLKMGWCCNCSGGGDRQYHAGDGIEIDAQDTISVDSSVMRYNINHSTLEDGSTVGYYRMNKEWGNQWYSKPGNRFEWLSTNQVINDTFAQTLHRLYARPSVLGGGGYMGWTSNYSAANGIVAQFGMHEYTNSVGSYTQYDRRSVSVAGTLTGNNAYSYRLPAQNNRASYDGFLAWDWNGSDHDAVIAPGLRGVATGTTDVNGDITVTLPAPGMPDATYLVLLTPIATTRYAVSAHTLTTTSFKINTGAGSGVPVTVHYKIEDF